MTETAPTWFKAMRTQDAMELIAHNPNAFVLAYVIACRSRVSNSFNRNNLEQGEAFIGDHDKCGMSEQQYRTAKQILTKFKFATFKSTNRGTVASLCDERLFAVSMVPSQRTVQQAANGQSTDSQRLTKNDRMGEWKEGDAPSLPLGLENLPASVNPLEALKLTINGWFGRRTSTVWSDKETKALKRVMDGNPTAEEIELLGHYQTTSEFRRRQVLTLLNNWAGDIDRARMDRQMGTGEPSREKREALRLKITKLEEAISEHPANMNSRRCIPERVTPEMESDLQAHIDRLKAMKDSL